MKIRHVLITILSLILFSNLTLGLGIAPVQHYEIFESGNSKAMSFIVFNNENKDMAISVSAKGDLEEYIKFNQNEYVLKKSDDSLTVNYMLNYPIELPPGAHYVDLIVSENPSGDSSTVVALQSQILKLRIQVPHDGDYAQAKMLIISAGNNVKFDINMYNFGVNDITADAIIDIYDDNHKVKSLRIDPKIIYSMKEDTLTGNSNLDAGNYIAKVLVYYERETIKLEENFFVGDRSIKILGMTVNNFQKDEIAKINLLLQNNWVDPIDNVKGEIVIYKDNKKIETIPTETFTIDKTKDLFTFWNTKGMAKGKYNAKATFYYDSTSTSKDLEIIVGGEDKETSAKTVDDKSELSLFSKVFFYVGILLFLMLVYLLWKLFWK
jgi:hypothetical protein